MFRSYLFITPTNIGKNADAVKAVLSHYFCTVVFEVQDKGGDSILGGRAWDYGLAEPNNYDLPQAVPEELLEFEFPDPDLLGREQLKRYGDVGFVNLLSELGPLLHSRLIVHVTLEGLDGVTTREWRVVPGSGYVEVNVHSEKASAYFMTSNVAAIDDRAVVERIFKKYHCNFAVNLRPVDENGPMGVSVFGWAPPLAVRLEEYGLLDASDDAREAYLALKNYEIGENGLDQLLVELAPHLKTALTVRRRDEVLFEIRQIPEEATQQQPTDPTPNTPTSGNP